MGTTVLTYGTFDLFHIGHLRLIERLRTLGDRLVIGVSSDEFNAVKGKKAVIPYIDRAAIVAAIRGVDLVFPEHDWDQKEHDVRKYSADIFAIGDDWKGKFDFLKPLCEVVYLPRTMGISTTEIRGLLIPQSAAGPVTSSPNHRRGEQ
jgi:glycerol-3-phosphate cytidylyltransferase